MKHYRSHERRGDVPGIPAAPPTRRRSTNRKAAARPGGMKEEEDEDEEKKTLVCDICAGVYSCEKALSLHLNGHKYDIPCGEEGCEEIFRSARALKEHKVRGKGERWGIQVRESHKRNMKVG